MTVGSRRCRSLALLLAAQLLDWGARAESRAGAELSALVESGNILNAVEPEPPFWESLGSLRSGRENRARLALAADDDGFWPGLTTRALLRLELGLAGLGEGRAATLSDASSALVLGWHTPGGLRWSFSAYPFDTDYVRLGYLHALDWGGTRVSSRESVFQAHVAGAPGFVLSASWGKLRLFSGAKWGQADASLGRHGRLWGAFSGGSLELTPSLRVDLGLGAFQRRPGALEGASLRWVWHQGVAEPEVAAEPFRPPTLREDPARLEADAALGASLALEAVLLGAQGGEPTEAGPRSTRLAPAAALYGSARGAIWAAHAVVSWRSLAFVLANDERFAAAPEITRAGDAELAAWLGVSGRLPRAALVPSLEVGARLPAVSRSPSPASGVWQLWLAGGSDGLRPLPPGSPRLPALAARLAWRWQLSRLLTLIVAGDYQRDPNRVRLESSGPLAVRVFDAPDSLTWVGGAEARW